jgi:hypothetical protein
MLETCQEKLGIVNDIAVVVVVVVVVVVTAVVAAVTAPV